MLPRFHLLQAKAHVIHVHDSSNGVMTGIVCLENRSARLLSTPCPPDHLHQGLNRALTCTVVGDLEGCIGIDDANESDIGEVMTFGDHLSSYEQLCLVLSYRIEVFHHASRMINRIPVDPDEFLSRKKALDFLFQPFRAEPMGGEGRMITGGAAFRLHSLPAAVMASKPVRFLMVGETHAAMVAMRDVSADFAKDEIRKSSSIEEKKCLVSPRNRFDNRFTEGS